MVVVGGHTFCHVYRTRLAVSLLEATCLPSIPQWTMVTGAHGSRGIPGSNQILQVVAGGKVGADGRENKQRVTEQEERC
jgi:hypothetical protein